MRLSQQSLPLHVERCCKCTVTSTCITSRCCCKKSNRLCTNCACFVKCLNLRPPDGDPPDLDQFIHEVETGLNLNDAASASDEKLFQAYEHILHQNSGYQLDGGIEDSGEWVDFHKRLVIFPTHRYDIPKGQIGRRFVSKLAELLESVIQRKMNSETFLVFQIVILQRCSDVRRACDIKKRLGWRLKAWEEGKYKMLVEDTEREMVSRMSKARAGTSSSGQRFKIFNDKVLLGDIRGAVKYLSNSETGGVLLPDDLDDKGRSVRSILLEKHPLPRIPLEDHFPVYQEMPEFVDLDITEDTVIEVAKNLSGSGGAGGTDSYTAQSWLLRFGEASCRLRVALANFTCWLANDFPPWASYRGLAVGRLLALDKCPGVRPIGIGETWRRAMAKCVLRVAGKEAKEACAINQLCAGLERGIEGAIHANTLQWEQHKQEEEWGFLLIDARNAFNELNRSVMLWNIRHEWPSGARFTFNFYKHWSTLVLRNPFGEAMFLNSMEGVTQGDPLAMVAYGIALLPLIRELQSSFPMVRQSWYADDAGAGGKFAELKKLFYELQILGPKFGYYPEPSKSIIIVKEADVNLAIDFFSDLQFKVMTGSRYLGGFIGDVLERNHWLSKKTESWCEVIDKLSQSAKNYPQSSYAALQKSLQCEWSFIHRVVSGVENQFQSVQDAIEKKFLPALFNESLEDEDPRISLSSLPLKFAGLGIPNVVRSASQSFNFSFMEAKYLVSSLNKGVKFLHADHFRAVREAKEVNRATSLKANNDFFDSISLSMGPSEKRTILRGKSTGQWLSVYPSLKNGTDLSAQEFRDSLFLRYSREVPDLPKLCDGCGGKFSVRHAFCCKNGGLIIARHDEIRDELVDLASKALKPSSVRDEPRINNCCESDVYCGAEVQSFVGPLKQSGERGDLLIRGLWSSGTDCIIDVRISDTDANFCRSRDPLKVLEENEKAKKKKYLGDCLNQRRHFTPFVVSADGLIAREAKSLLRKISSLLAVKSGKSYSEVCGFVNARMSIAIVRATHLCLRGSRIPTSKMSSRRPFWEDSMGISLFKF